MARTISFSWKETDDNLIKWYDSLTNKFGSLLSKSVSDYRLQSQGAGGESQTAPSSTASGPQPTPPAPPGDRIFTLKTEILEDIEFDLSTSFGTAGDAIPFSGLLSSLGRINNLFSGQSPEILNIFKVPTWESTAPLTINLKPVLYTRTNSILDVLIPALSISSLTILKVNKKGEFRTPGIYMGNLGTALNRSGEKKPEANQPSGGTTPGQTDTASSATNKSLENLNGSFISFRVPGLLKIQYALLEKCKPTFSKQITESGGPLWCVLDMQIRTLLPASSKELFNEYGFNEENPTNPNVAGGGSTTFF